MNLHNGRNGMELSEEKFECYYMSEGYSMNEKIYIYYGWYNSPWYTPLEYA